MATDYYEIPATDDMWIEAAGFDPTIHPQFITVEQFLKKNSAGQDVIDLLKQDGFAELKKKYSLKERFKKYGVDIVKQYDGEIELSNGVCLFEDVDVELSRKQRAYFADDNCYVTAHCVKRKTDENF